MSKNKDKADIEKPWKTNADYFASKAERQAAFLKACEGLTTEEINKKASMFTGINVSNFKIIRKTD